MRNMFFPLLEHYWLFQLSDLVYCDTRSPWFSRRSHRVPDWPRERWRFQGTLSSLWMALATNRRWKNRRNRGKPMGKIDNNREANQAGGVSQSEHNIKGSVVRKLPSYGQMSRSSLFIMSSSDHYTIVTSSCVHHANKQESEQEQFACGTSRGVRSAWIHGWKRFRAQNPVFTGNVASGSPK